LANSTEYQGSEVEPLSPIHARRQFTSALPNRALKVRGAKNRAARLSRSRLLLAVAACGERLIWSLPRAPPKLGAEPVRVWHVRVQPGAEMRAIALSPLPRSGSAGRGEARHPDGGCLWRVTWFLPLQFTVVFGSVGVRRSSSRKGPLYVHEDDAASDGSTSGDTCRERRRAGGALERFVW
jgi:hypothetical protein